VRGSQLHLTRAERASAKPQSIDDRWCGFCSASRCVATILALEVLAHQVTAKAAAVLTLKEGGQACSDHGDDLPAAERADTAYGCGLKGGRGGRLRAGDIDSEQMIIRIVQSKAHSGPPT